MDLLGIVPILAGCPCWFLEPAWTGCRPLLTLEDDEAARQTAAAWLLVHPSTACRGNAQAVTIKEPLEIRFQSRPSPGLETWTAPGVQQCSAGPVGVLLGARKGLIISIMICILIAGLLLLLYAYCCRQDLQQSLFKFFIRTQCLCPCPQKGLTGPFRPLKFVQLCSSTTLYTVSFSLIAVK